MSASFAAVATNIEQAFDQAGRKLAAGFQRTYLKARMGGTEAGDLGTIKRELWVIVADDGARRMIENRAEELCDAELDAFDARINNEVGDEERFEYRTIGRHRATPKPEPWSPPTEIDGPNDGQAFSKHLFVKPDHSYTNDELNTLERDTLAEELARKGVIGWLRNEDRKPWAFGINYEKGGLPSTMYPDFLIFRKDGGHVVTDVLEPHSTSQADSVNKVKGLADFAAKHGDDFGRIEFIDRVDGVLKRLNLRDPKLQQRAKTIEGIDHLKQLLEDV